MNNAISITEKFIDEQNKSIKVISSKEIIPPFTNIDHSVSAMLTTDRKKSVKASVQPWLNEDGTKKPDREIARLGQFWSTKIWSEYLDYDLGEIKDDLAFFDDMDTSTVYERSEILKFLQECEYNEPVENALLLAMIELAPLEKEVLKYSFWRLIQDIEIAKILNTSHGSVRTTKSKAIKKLGTILTSARFKTKIKLLKKTKKFNSKIRKQKQWLNKK